MTAEIYGALTVSDEAATAAAEGSPIGWRFTVAADHDEDDPGVFLRGEETTLFLRPDAVRELIIELTRAANELP